MRAHAGRWTVHCPRFGDDVVIDEALIDPEQGVLDDEEFAAAGNDAVAEGPFHWGSYGVVPNFQCAQRIERLTRAARAIKAHAKRRQ